MDCGLLECAGANFWQLLMLAALLLVIVAAVAVFLVVSIVGITKAVKHLRAKQFVGINWEDRPVKEPGPSRPWGTIIVIACGLGLILAFFVVTIILAVT